MMQILLMLKVLFTQILRLNICYVMLLPALTSMFFSENLFSLRIESDEDDFQHVFTRMTDDRGR